MPLHRDRVHVADLPQATGDDQFVIDFTNERCEDDLERKGKLDFYARPIFKNRVTHEGGLAYNEVLIAERELRDNIGREVETELAKTLLSLVHHDKRPEGVLVAELVAIANSTFPDGIAVRLKNKHGMVGQIKCETTANTMEGAGVSPSSDKENASSPSPMYTITFEVHGESKGPCVVKSVPRDTIERNPPITAELLQQFLRLNASRSRTTVVANVTNGLWEVDLAVCKRYGIVGKVASLFLSTPSSKTSKPLSNSARLQSGSVNRASVSGTSADGNRTPHRSTAKKSRPSNDPPSLPPKEVAKKTNDSSSDDDDHIVVQPRRSGGMAPSSTMRKQQEKKMHADQKKQTNKALTVATAGKPMSIKDAWKGVTAKSSSSTSAAAPKKTPLQMVAERDAKRLTAILEQLKFARAANNKTKVASVLSCVFKAYKWTSKQIMAVEEEEPRMFFLDRYEAFLEKERLAKMTPSQRESHNAAKMEATKEEKEAKRNERLAGRRAEFEKERKARELRNVKWEDTLLADQSPLPTAMRVTLPASATMEDYSRALLVTQFVQAYRGMLGVEVAAVPSAEQLLVMMDVNGAEENAQVNLLIRSMVAKYLKDDNAKDLYDLRFPLNAIHVWSHAVGDLLRIVVSEREPLKTFMEEVKEKKKETLDNNEGEEEEGSSSAVKNENKFTMAPRALTDRLRTEDLHDMPLADRLILIEALVDRMTMTECVDDHQKHMEKMANDAISWRYSSTLERSKTRAQWATEDEEWMAEEAKHVKGPLDQFVKANDEVKTIDSDSADSGDGRRKASSRTAKRKVDDAREAVDKERFAREQKREKCMKKREKKQTEWREAEEDYHRAQRDLLAALHLLPLGADRDHARYWLLDQDVPRLLVERAYMAVDTLTFSTFVGKSPSKSPTKCADMPTLAPQAERRGSGRNTETTAPPSDALIEWTSYDGVEQITALLTSLNAQGVRESKLKKQLETRLNRINARIASGEIKSAGVTTETASTDGSGEDSDDEERVSNRRVLRSKSQAIDAQASYDKVDIRTAFRETLTELEMSLREGGMGGVADLDDWQGRLQEGEEVDQLAQCLLQTHKYIQPFCLRGMLESSKSANIKSILAVDGEATTIHHELSKVQRWINAVSACRSMSRLHFLLSMLDASIDWSKTIQNARCRVCRSQKNADEMLICDGCNAGMHTYCCKPILYKAPIGDWFCDGCRPAIESEKKKRKIARGDDEEEEEVKEENTESEAVASTVEEEDSDAPAMRVTRQKRGAKGKINNKIAARLREFASSAESTCDSTDGSVDGRRKAPAAKRRRKAVTADLFEDGATTDDDDAQRGTARRSTRGKKSVTGELAEALGDTEYETVHSVFVKMCTDRFCQSNLMSLDGGKTEVGSRTTRGREKKPSSTPRSMTEVEQRIPSYSRGVAQLFQDVEAVVQRAREVFTSNSRKLSQLGEFEEMLAVLKSTEL